MEMGVSFSWKPTDPNEGVIFASGSNLHRILERAFGDFPLLLVKTDVPKLEGIAACNNDDILELITAIHEHGDVTVMAHW